MYSIRIGIRLLCCLVVATACASSSNRPRVYHGEVELRYTPQGERPQSVFVAGTFNDWVMLDPRFRMNWDATSQRFYIRLRLKPGRYQYKLIVDGRWMLDPNATASAPDPLGGRYGIFIVRRR